MLGSSCIFVTSRLDKVGLELVLEEAFQTVSDEYAMRLEAGDNELLVVDGYSFDQMDINRYGQTRTTALFEDYSHRQISVDIIIDANLATETTPIFQDSYSYKLLLAGPQFLVLGAEYRHALNYYGVGARRENSLLVTMGGSDRQKATEQVLASLSKKYNPFDSVTVVIGPLVVESRIHEMRALLPSQNTRFVLAPKSLLEEYQNHSHAIGAGGVSAYERAKLSLPSLNLVTELNQKRVVSEIENLGLGVGLDAMGPNWQTRIPESVQTLFEIRDLSTKEVDNGNIIDGFGSDRLALKLQGAVPFLR